MKKLIMTAAAVFAFGFANAQEVKFGPKVALNYSNVATTTNNPGDLSTSGKIGFQIGGFVEFKFNDKISLQPELLFSRQGNNQTYTETESSNFLGNKMEISTESKSTVSLSYLNIPVMFKYYVAEGLNLELGPQFGYLLSLNSKTDETITETITTDSSTETTVTPFSYEFSSKDFVNSFDLGINAGVGYDVIENLNLGLRYNLGLTNIAKAAGNTAKNRNISLSVAYKF